MLNEAENEAVESFTLALADLTVNSKPLINFLTMLAKGNIGCAEAIVDAIDDHLKKVSSVMKLPILYLIDSILKNVGMDYTSLLSHLICNSFADIYTEVDKKTRLLMLKVRQTWGDIISIKDLHNLDLKINVVDPDWPFTGGIFHAQRVAPLKVLINPKFLPPASDNSKFVDSPTRRDNMNSSEIFELNDINDHTAEEIILREELLLEKRKRELHRQKKKVDFELLKVKAKYDCDSKRNCEAEADVLSKERVLKDSAGNSEPNESQVDSTTNVISTTLPYENEEFFLKSDIQSSRSLENTESLLSHDKYARGELLQFLTKLIDKRNPQSMRRSRNKTPSGKSYRSCSSKYDSWSRHKKERSVADHPRIETPDRSNTPQRHRDHRYWDANNRQIKEEEKYQQKIVSSAERSDVLNKYVTAPISKWQSKETKCGFHPENSSANMSLRKEEFGPLYKNSKDVSFSNPNTHKTSLSPTNCNETVLLTHHQSCSNSEQRSHFRKLDGKILKTGQAAEELCDEYPGLENLHLPRKNKSLLPIPLVAPSYHGNDVDVFDCDVGNGGLGLGHSPHSSLKRPLLREFPKDVHKSKLMRADIEENIFSLPPVSESELDQINQDTMKMITVDNIARKIRFYGEIAVAIYDENISREIFFQPGEAFVLINNVVIQCAFHKPEKEVLLDGKIFRVHLGAPTRELYVNDEGFQCSFNYPCKEILLATGEILQVQLQSDSPPLVQVGTQRQDLVAGHVMLIINDTDLVQIYLDAKPQRFDIDGTPHILKFEDALQTVLVNGYPVNMQFGGPDIAIVVNGKLHYIRLSALPPGVVPGEVNIISMSSRKERSVPLCEYSSQICQNSSFTSKTPLPSRNISVETERKLFQPPHVFQLAALPYRSVRGMGKNSTARKKKKNKKKNSRMSANFLDSVHHGLSYRNTTVNITSEPMKSTGFVWPAVSGAIPQFGIISSSVATTCSSSQPIFKPDVNIHSLFERLCRSGLLSCVSPVSSKNEEAILDVNEINFNNSVSLKKKQTGIIENLYSGSQCSSCGLRFSDKHIETLRKHLDWHFQQNHQTKDSGTIRSRAWYPKKTDWINNGDTIDLHVNEEVENSNMAVKKLEDLPCIPSHDYPQEVHCELCHDKFEEFFNEEEDEWQLKNCIENEGHTYHLYCFKDLQLTNTSTSNSRLENKDVMNQSQDDIHEQTLNAALKSSNCLAHYSFQEVLGSERVDDRKEDECTKEISNFGPMSFHFVSDNEQLMQVTPNGKPVPSFSAAKVKITVANVQYECVTKDGDNESINKQICLSIPAPQGLETSNLKPKLHGRKLTQLPPATKDFETSNLCAIV